MHPKRSKKWAWSWSLACAPDSRRCCDWCGIETESKETMEPGAWTSESVQNGVPKKHEKLGC